MSHFIFPLFFSLSFIHLFYSYLYSFLSIVRNISPRLLFSIFYARFPLYLFLFLFVGYLQHEVAPFHHRIKFFQQKL